LCKFVFISQAAAASHAGMGVKAWLGRCEVISGLLYDRVLLLGRTVWCCVLLRCDATNILCWFTMWCGVVWCDVMCVW
jgi:hypothetical protein